VIVFGSAAFFVFGVVLVLVGANQADLARALDLDLSGSGLLVSALAVGVGIGVVASGPLVDRLPRRALFAGSALLAGVALLLFEASISLPRALFQMALIGVGIGFHETVINVSVSEIYGARAARALLIVHTPVTAGAVLAPLGIGWLVGHSDWVMSFRVTGAAELALALCALPIRFPPAQAHVAATREQARAVLSPALIPFLVVGFAYVGVETALTLLAVPYAEGALSLSAETGRIAISALWGGLLAGRLSVLALRVRLDARLLAAAGLAGSLALGVGVGSGSSQLALVYAATGLSMGFVFPLMIALTAERFPDARGTATGLAAGTAALGGFAVPWLHGVLGDAAGVTAAVLALAPWCMAVAVAALGAARRASR
jgi:fucose permease